MKKIAMLAGVLALTAGVLTFSNAAVAEPAAVAAPNCAGRIVSANTVENPNGFRFGAVQVCADSAGRYFAYFVMDATMPAGRWGTAILYRHENGFPVNSITCDGGGNGRILPGQTRCETAHVSASSTQTFSGEAWYCAGSSYQPACLVGFGETNRAR